MPSLIAKLPCGLLKRSSTKNVASLHSLLHESDSTLCRTRRHCITITVKSTTDEIFIFRHLNLGFGPDSHTGITLIPDRCFCRVMVLDF